MATLEDFQRLGLKVARVTEVQPHPDADRLYVLTIDVGGRTKTIVAGLRMAYTPEELRGKSIIIVDNLEPAQIRGIESQGMLLAAQDGDDITILVPERPVRPGSPIH